MKRAALYVRVSTDDQRTDLQRDEGRARVKARGWKLLDTYSDEGVSGSKARRPELDRLLEDARKKRFDVLVVWRMDRLFRSLAHMVTTLEELHALGIDFVSCTETIDTSTPQGRLVFHVMAAMAQFERELAVERTVAGMSAARRRGAKIGRPRTYVDVTKATKLLGRGVSIREAAKKLGIGFATLHRAVKRGVVETAAEPSGTTRAASARQKGPLST